MIKSSMEFLDILFPINLGPFTYRCPDELLGVAEPGMIVSAPLKNRIAKGIITGKSLIVPSGDVKDIQKVYGDAPVLSSNMINLLRWMSEYYLTEKGVVLKTMLPKEAFTKVRPRKAKIPPYPPSIPPLPRGDKEESKGAVSSLALNLIQGSINKKAYRTFLLHAPSSAYEYSFVVKILSGAENAILLIPEVSQIDTLYPLLKEKFGERVCLLHSGLSRGKRSEAIERILLGSSDIVLGTRSAVFAPLKKVSSIAVLHEHSSSYKQGEGLRYSGRDVAVMRGYLERATVLLSSICPSIESLYNCRSGKYNLVKPEGDIKKPRVRVIDMKHEKLLKPYLSKRVIDASMRYIKNDKKVMFLINRRGYSLLQCTECNYIQECPDCRIPLVFHKHDSSLKCHYCGYISDVPESCLRCKGYSVKLLGAGTQRVQEDIEELLGIKTLRLDSDVSRKRSEVEGLIGAMYKDDVRIIVGTKFMTRRLGPESSSGSGGFSMAAILNTDLFLNLPDFRSVEKAYQEISSIIDKIEPQGEIFIQTRMPQNYLFKYLKDYNYDSFFREELSRRKSLRYPPYSRLLLIKFISKKDLSRKLSEILERAGKEVEILGPSISKNTQGKYEFKLLLKSSIRGGLHFVARTFMEIFKESKDVKIKVDVDPISI
ncbi:MAG: primosomal protein N' [Thermodesulfovibrionales bacterium]|nr:primosomal protein N' [Thermodesulfovibrionales bacterium]